MWNDELRDALDAADAVFERRYKPAEALCMYCPQGGEKDDEHARFEGIVRAHRAHRRTMPVFALAAISFGHGNSLVHQSVRRLAYFVPAFLSAALGDGDGDGGAGPGTFARVMRALAEAVAEARGGEALSEPNAPVDFTDGERSALGAFLLAAVRALVVGPATDEDAGESGRDALARTFDVARVAGLDLAPLTGAWLARAETDETARAHLFAAIAAVTAPDAWIDRYPDEHRSDPATTLHLALVREDVRAWLEARWFTAEGAVADAFSQAELAVREALGVRAA